MQSWGCLWIFSPLWQRSHRSRGFCMWKVSYFETSHSRVVIPLEGPPGIPEAGRKMQVWSQGHKQLHSTWGGEGIWCSLHLRVFKCTLYNCCSGGAKPLRDLAKQTDLKWKWSKMHRVQWGECGHDFDVQTVRICVSQEDWLFTSEVRLQVGKSSTGHSLGWGWMGQDPVSSQALAFLALPM